MSVLTKRVRINDGWLFGGEIPLPGPEDHLDARMVLHYSGDDLDDSGWQHVVLPHTVTPLSWKLWDPSTWEKVWAYRRVLTIPDSLAGRRIFLDFEAVMTTAVVTVNGVLLGEHRGGYLPFSFEITDHLRRGEPNTLAVIVDSRFNLNIPPNITSPAPSSSLDYLQPGGIHRDVWLRAEPATHVVSLQISHHDVLDPQARSSSIVVGVDSLDAAVDLEAVIELSTPDGQVVAGNRSPIDRLDAGLTELSLHLGGLADIALWDLDSPTLYTLTVTLEQAGRALASTALRTGYREARFELDGFFLNGVRRYLLGVNRHGYYPYTGFAMPARVQRRDAQIIKNDLNCVMVRCSHYPQSAAFLDACDELGLLVWEESPGWQHVGDQDWQDRAADDIAKMIARDRHRPSVIVWGARLNETPDRPDFYGRTEALVKALDPTRATSGTMHGDYARTATFQHDVFGYDDYNTTIDADGERRPVLLPPVPDRPYLISEAISTRSSPTTLYRRADPATVQQHQALDYAQGHDDAMGDSRFAGLLAWVGFDYQANMGNFYHGIKTSGLGDVFRILKPGAAIYRSQLDPVRGPVLEPAFTWDPPEFGQANAFGNRPEGRRWGPGNRAMICSNLDHVEVYLGDRLVADVKPDRERFPHLAHAPSFVDLTFGADDRLDLTLNGYLGDDVVAVRRYSGDRSADSLTVAADDRQLVADGVDATRVTLSVVDRFGQARGSSRARVVIEIDGPGELIGESPFDLEDSGAVGAVWVRTTAGVSGVIILRASTREFGSSTVVIESLIPSEDDSER